MTQPPAGEPAHTYPGHHVGGLAPPVADARAHHPPAPAWFLRYLGDVPIPSPRAIAPSLSARTSSTGVSYYIQQRTSLFARVALACACAGLTIRGIADAVKGHPERIVANVYVCLGVSISSFIALWLATRRKPRPLYVVRILEAVVTATGLVAASFGFRLATPGLLGAVTSFGIANPDILAGGDPGLLRVLFELTSLMTGLLVATQMLALRAALVPSSLKHSLVLTALVGFPLCLFTSIGWPAMLPPEMTFTRSDRAFLFTFGTNWWLFTGAVCAVISRVVHRLQSEVQVARRLGQYELRDKIGEGGMGVVYRARHAMMKRPVAIKLLPAEAAGQDALTRFEREVQLTSQLSHPNTVVIHDYGRTHEGVFYYVMEFIEGPTLERVIKTKGPMPSGRVVRILEMVAGALAEAHERGLVHRDIKPANILIGPRGGEPDVAKVLDFGLVRLIRAQAEVTNAGVMMGTPLFMSPEAIRHPDRVDGSSDLYSLGAVAYYLLSGRLVFEAESPIEICAKHMHAKPRPPSELVSGIDPTLEALVLACLAKEPAQRPASARALCDALARCPSRGEWTREHAEAWWDENRDLLHGGESSDTAPTDVSQIVA